MNVRINQTGSIANFIIIGVVLVVLTGGVIYAVRQKDVPSPRPTPIASEPNKSSDSPKKDKTPAAEGSTPAPAPSTPAVSDTPAATPPAPTVATISQTGPADTAWQLFAIGAIVVVGISFMRSRSLRSSL